MKKAAFFAIFICSLLSILADGNRKLEGQFLNKENNIVIQINLYDTIILTPNYEFLGEMNGFMRGNIHEVWFLNAFHIHNDSTATLHFSNEMGSDDQELLIQIKDSVNMSYEVVGTNNIRKVQNGKWVKLPAKMTFQRQFKAALPPHQQERKFRMY